MISFLTKFPMNYPILFGIGSQFADAIDSLSANIAEGFGRYHKKDKIKFYYNARGSTYESLSWLEKAKDRKLLTPEEYTKIIKTLKEIPLEINKLIVYTNRKLDK